MPDPRMPEPLNLSDPVNFCVDRDKVNALAADEFGGASADKVIERLLADHQKIRILEGLRPPGWRP